jgi:hypothetical protein
MSFSVMFNELGFVMAGYFMFGHAGTEADFVL